MRGVLLACVCLVLSGCVTIGKPDAPELPREIDWGPWTLPPLRVGDAAHYAVVGEDGQWARDVRVHVGEPTEALAADGELRPVVPLVRRAASTPGQVATLDMLLEGGVLARESTTCAELEDSRDCDRRVSWGVHGAPAIWGAGSLHGFELHANDSWHEAACAWCDGPWAIAIEPAEAGSPSGTAFVARFELRWDAPGANTDRWALHMGREHAWPLRVDIGDRPLHLVQHQRGAAPLAIDPDAQPLSPPLSPAPYDGPRPDEGVPLAGWSSFAEARAATGDDGRRGGWCPDLQVHRWRETFPSPSLHGLLLGEDTLRMAETCISTSQAVTHSYFMYPRTGSPLEPAGPHWDLQTHDRDADASDRCAPLTAPFWDVARAATRALDEHEEHVYQIALYNNCPRAHFIVIAAAEGREWTVTVHPENGLLEWLTVQ